MACSERPRSEVSKCRPRKLEVARLAAAQVAAFEKLSAEGASTLAVVNKRYCLVATVTLRPFA
jgi:hypothetical protein